MSPSAGAHIASCLLVLWLAGCGAQVTLTRRGGSAAERPRCCDVVVVRQRPAHDWDEVGVLDLEAFSVRALPRDDASFLQLVRPFVCQAGGDAVFPGVNRDGRYVMGTVLKFRRPGSPTPPKAATGTGEPPQTATCQGTTPC